MQQEQAVRPTLIPEFLADSNRPKSVGYVVMRAGDGGNGGDADIGSSMSGVDGARVMLVLPFLFQPKRVRLGDGNMDVQLGSREPTASGPTLRLEGLPADVADRARREPQSVLLVSVDVLGQPRSASRVSDLLQ